MKALPIALLMSAFFVTGASAQSTLEIGDTININNTPVCNSEANIRKAAEKFDRNYQEMRRFVLGKAKFKDATNRPVCFFAPRSQVEVVGIMGRYGEEDRNLHVVMSSYPHGGKRYLGVTLVIAKIEESSL